MRTQITEMPTNGVVVQRGNYSNAMVYMYKDPLTETVDGVEVLTADVETLEVPWYEGLQAYMESDFEANFNKAKVLSKQVRLDALNASYTTKKNKLHEAHSAILLSPFLTDAEKTEEVANIQTDYTALVTKLLTEQGGIING
jgi:DNA phosphorothioation-dependent restriction protein DptG